MQSHRGFINEGVGAPGKLTGCEDDFPIWFDILEDHFCYKGVWVKNFCSPGKTFCPPAENINFT